MTPVGTKEAPTATTAILQPLGTADALIVTSSSETSILDRWADPVSVVADAAP